jgi:hypothetical protein
VKVFEVDRPVTQELKKQRVRDVLGTPPSNLTYVPVDFQHDDLLEVLTRHGYDRTQRTFFILEGVTMYLPEEAARETLRFVGAHPQGSGIVFDFVYRATIDMIAKIDMAKIPEAAADVSGANAGTTAACCVSPGRSGRRRLALNPELRLPRPVVGSLDVPVLAQRIVIHCRHEVEGRLELDVVEARVRSDELMPFACRDEHQATGPDSERAGVVLHFAGAFLDEIEMLRRHGTRLRRPMDVPR